MTNNDAPDACRQEFEKWVTDNNNYSYLKHKNFGGKYLNDDVCFQWDAWKAAWNTRPQPCADAVEILNGLCAEDLGHGEKICLTADEIKQIRAALAPVDVEEYQNAKNCLEAAIRIARENRVPSVNLLLVVENHLAARGFGVPKGYTLVPDDCRKADIDSGALDGFKGDLNDAYHNIQNYINWAKAAPKKEVKS